jgi:YVTN family beta-propeller protein
MFPAVSLVWMAVRDGMSGRGRHVLLVAALAVAVGAGAVACGSDQHAVTTTGETKRTKPAVRVRLQPPRVLQERTVGALPAPVQDAAAAKTATGVLLLGGLTAADTSTASIVVVRSAHGSLTGSLPVAVHDAAAVSLARAVYLFGGGTGSSQLDTIVRVNGAGRAAGTVGTLPAPSSDQAAAAIGGTAYIVGGYTGSAWLDTIVAWRPGGKARVVAHLPFPVRYAAVTAVGGRLLIAGGSLASGTASPAVLEYIPATRRVVRLGVLPAPTTHAAAAAIGNVAYVIGGRGAALDSRTDAIVAVDIRTGRIRPAGNLDRPRSDLAATALGRSILIAGGRTSAGTVPDVSLLAAGVRRHVTARALPFAAKAGNVYAFDSANRLAPAARAAVPRIYVPNSVSDTVDVIDPKTYKIVEHFAVGGLPQHVVPAWNLKTLYVTNDTGNSLTTIDPKTGKPGRTISVDDPYNLYFTPDGRYAIVVAERLQRLDFRDAHTFALHKSLTLPCVGPDHMDFSADGSYLIVSCEFSGQMVKVDVQHESVLGVLDLPDGRGGMPQDVKLSPNGAVFYVADMRAGGVWEVDGTRLKVTGFLRTGSNAHGLYPSRDAKSLYVTNRGEGSISVISFRTRKVVKKWYIPGGGSPDMGGVSADGKVLWLSGRYSRVVYAISSRSGRLLARIPVGSGPHGLCVWPQPGRYSLGHTGILR